MDFVEIDAASNRRIDDIRELIDKIQFSPLIAKTKVYIIDEVHMLTKRGVQRAAENAGRAAKLRIFYSGCNRTAQSPRHHSIALSALSLQAVKPEI